MDALAQVMRELFVALLWLLTFVLVILLPLTPTLMWSMLGFMFAVAIVSLLVDVRRQE